MGVSIHLIIETVSALSVQKMFKFILLAAALLFAVTAMPHDDKTYKKRSAKPYNFPVIMEEGDPGICIGRSSCLNSRCAICCETVEDCSGYIRNVIQQQKQMYL